MRRKCNVMISQTARIVRRLVSVLIIASMVGCASQAVQAPLKSTAKSYNTADQAAAVALRQIGVPYRYGGSTPNGFDCSGLIYYSYSRAGKNVPRTTGTLWSGIQPVAQSQMQVGDVLFFRIEGKMSHVGMYIGDNQFVHAPASGKSVTVGSLRSDFYRKALIRAGRPD
jgi:murein DD-endopeptidase